MSELLLTSFTCVVSMNDALVLGTAQHKREKDRLAKQRYRARKRAEAAANAVHADSPDGPEEKREDFAPPNDPLRSPATSAAEPADGFDAFWAAYPRKEDRADAIAMWNRLSPNKTQRAVLRATLEMRKASAEWADPGNIPSPAAWLRDQHSPDEIPQQETLRERIERLSRERRHLA
jgi:hypothetical protein